MVPTVLESILNKYCNPPTKHLALTSTCVVLLGELSEWVHKHPDYLSKYFITSHSVDLVLPCGSSCFNNINADLAT